MTLTVPLSDLSRRTTEVLALLGEADVILGRRDDADLYLSTRERHEMEIRGLTVASRALAALASVRPDLAETALTEALPWMGWMPSADRALCLQELLSDLRTGSETGQLHPLSLSLAAWQSTAVAWADPDVGPALQRDAPDPSRRTAQRSPDRAREAWGRDPSSPTMGAASSEPSGSQGVGKPA